MRSTHFNGILATLGLVMSFAALPVQSASAGEEECQLRESGRLPPFPLFGLGSGGLVATSSELFIGIPSFDPGTGAVHIYVREGDGWTLQQVLTALDAGTQEYFGTSIAVDGKVAVIGSPEHEANGIPSGAAYVFERRGSSWAQVAKLLPSDATEWKRFGCAVAIQGDTVVVGARADGFFGGETGGAYVFGYDGMNWIERQKLVGSDSLPYDRFGTSVVLQGNELLISAPERKVGTIERVGAVYVFRHNGTTWQEHQIIVSPEFEVQDYLGTSLALSGDVLVAGAPSNWGSNAHVFLRQGDNWTFAQRLVPSSTAIQIAFGTSVTIRGTTILVGAPDDVVFAGSHGNIPGGRIYAFEHDGNAWVEAEQFTSLQPQRLRKIGMRIAILDNDVFATGQANSLFGDAVLVFRMPPDNCDGDDIPDQCSMDCNANDRADECELIANPLSDCNGNWVPDECDATFTYALDHGLMPVFWGYFQAVDFLWLNQFAVKHGGQYITHICMPWSQSLASFTPVELLLYDDPNNDGNPNDATLITSFTSRIVVESPESNLQGPMACIEIPRTHVGEPGDSFFVGALVRLHAQSYPAYADFSLPNAGRSWVRLALPGTLDISAPASEGAINAFSRNWWLRALALDCNSNGIWDQCDIDDGVSLDLNANGVPDECDAPCPADINGSGGVNISDLLAVISAWGTPGSGGEDVNGDNIVDVADLLAVIAAWGTCP